MATLYGVKLYAVKHNLGSCLILLALWRRMEFAARFPWYVFIAPRVTWTGERLMVFATEK